jgi:molybdopterin converting factor small subunit
MILELELMPTLRLASPLFALVPESERERSGQTRSLSMRSSTWPALAEEIRVRFPALADRVLPETDSISGGFVLVVNDEVVSLSGVSVELGDGDEVCLLAAIAGG